ncbi:MAG: formate/nitrite transporter family protein [Granulosicoccus sp.]
MTEDMREKSAKERNREKAKIHDEAKSAQGLSSPTVYEIISLEGIEEMRRPVKSLWWSGVAAGLAISLSLYVMAALRVSLGGDGPSAIEKLGYCFGFLVVVLSRLQLFTENTITPILPALKHRQASMLWSVARLWGIVLVANLSGTFLAALIPTYVPTVGAELYAAMLDISHHFSERAYSSVFFSAIPAGFMVAAMVWMLPNSKNFEFWTISAVTFAIAITDTSHVIVGSTELFLVLLNGESSLPEAATRLFLAGAGNIFGGSALFAVLAYGQVSEEI